MTPTSTPVHRLDCLVVVLETVAKHHTVYVWPKGTSRPHIYKYLHTLLLYFFSFSSNMKDPDSVKDKDVYFLSPLKWISQNCTGTSFVITSEFQFLWQSNKPVLLVNTVPIKPGLLPSVVPNTDFSKNAIRHQSAKGLGYLINDVICQVLSKNIRRLSMCVK